MKDVKIILKRTVFMTHPVFKHVFQDLLENYWQLNYIHIKSQKSSNF